MKQKLIGILAIALIAIIGVGSFASFAFADTTDNSAVTNPVAVAATVNGNGNHFPMEMTPEQAQLRQEMMAKLKTFRDQHKAEIDALKAKADALKAQYQQFKNDKKEITQDMKDQLKALRTEFNQLKTEFRNITGMPPQVGSFQKYILGTDAKAQVTTLIGQTNFTDEQKTTLMNALDAGHIFGKKPMDNYVFWTKDGAVSWGKFSGNVGKGQDIQGNDVKIFAADGLFVGTEGTKTVWGSYSNGAIGVYDFGTTGTTTDMQTGWYVTYSS